MIITFTCITCLFIYIESFVLKVNRKADLGWAKVDVHMPKRLWINKIFFFPRWPLPAGAGNRLVHWLLGSHLLFIPRLPRGKQVQQGLCYLRRCLVVGHGECICFVFYIKCLHCYCNFFTNVCPALDAENQRLLLLFGLSLPLSTDSSSINISCARLH